MANLLEVLAASLMGAGTGDPGAYQKLKNQRIGLQQQAEEFKLRQQEAKARLKLHDLRLTQLQEEMRRENESIFKRQGKAGGIATSRTPGTIDMERSPGGGYESRIGTPEPSGEDSLEGSILAALSKGSLKPEAGTEPSLVDYAPTQKVFDKGRAYGSTPFIPTRDYAPTQRVFDKGRVYGFPPSMPTSLTLPPPEYAAIKARNAAAARGEPLGSTIPTGMRPDGTAKGPGFVTTPPAKVGSPQPAFFMGALPATGPFAQTGEQVQPTYNVSDYGPGENPEAASIKATLDVPAYTAPVTRRDFKEYGGIPGLIGMGMLQKEDIEKMGVPNTKKVVKVLKDGRYVTQDLFGNTAIEGAAGEEDVPVKVAQVGGRVVAYPSKVPKKTFDQIEADRQEIEAAKQMATGLPFMPTGETIDEYGRATGKQFPTVDIGAATPKAGRFVGYEEWKKENPEGTYKQYREWESGLKKKGGTTKPYYRDTFDPATGNTSRQEFGMDENGNWTIPKGKPRIIKGLKPEKPKMTPDDKKKMFADYNIARAKAPADPIRLQMIQTMKQMGIDVPVSLPAMTFEEFDRYITTGKMPGENPIKETPKESSSAEGKKRRPLSAFEKE